MGVISFIKKCKRCFIPSHSDLGSAGKNSKIEYPVYIGCAKTFHMEDNCLLRRGALIQNSPNEHVYIKKYTAIAYNCTIVTSNHKSTVGIPHILLGASHINDVSKNINIDEDVWVGVNVTILPGGNLGRGCIVGACSVVNKEIPPYALVVGSPAKIVGVKFSLEQILEHEKALYPVAERMTREELEELFAKYYKGMRVFGIQKDFSEEDFAALEVAKKKRRYIEPIIDD